MNALGSLEHVLTANGLLGAFAAVGALMWLREQVSQRLTRGRVHGSAIAILAALAAAYAAGLFTGGHKGVTDLPALTGIGLLGGAMLRDIAITATAFEVDVDRARKAGLVGVLALACDTLLPFMIGVLVAATFGYRDAVSLTTIGAGAITYIVGPVTGAALGANSAFIALSIATGVLKAVLVMVVTPLASRAVGLDNPRSEMVFGGLKGTVSGVSGDLAATDRRLVPYGALTATFHTGIGCLMAPSLLFLAVRALSGG